MGGQERRMWQLVSPSPLIPQAPTQCREERLWMAENVVFGNSPQEAAVSRLVGSAQGESLELSQQFIFHF